MNLLKLFPKKKGIYLDCGAHHGEGLAQFIDMHSMADPGWKAFSFEPNNDSFNRVTKETFKLKNVQFYNKAVWIKDGTIEFHAETPPYSKTSDGAGSSIIDLKDWTPKSENNPGVGEFHHTYQVECIHLAKFILDNFSTKDFIVLKLDVEGAEFEILPDLIKTGAIKYIDHLYVEFHEWAMNSKSPQSKVDMIKDVKKANPKIKFTDWH